jgi:hypothetical protein
MLDFDLMPKFKPHSVRIFELIPIWAHAYQVDEQAVMRQIPIAYAWYLANPSKFPKKNVCRALNTWMKKAKEFGNLMPTQNSKLYKENIPPESERLTYEEIQAMKGSK